MKYDPQKHHRRSIRLKGYDYSQPGAYFVTICTHNREHLFGEIVNDVMRLNEFGDIVQYIWHDLVNHVDGIELGEFVVMPNHIHGIINIVVGAGPVGVGSVGVGSEPTPTTAAPTEPTHAIPLSEIVRQLKTFSARRINEQRGTRGIPVWQRNYYEHIIRDEKSYQRIAEYIFNNPAKWQHDDYFEVAP